MFCTFFVCFAHYLDGLHFITTASMLFEHLLQMTIRSGLNFCIFFGPVRLFVFWVVFMFLLILYFLSISSSLSLAIVTSAVNCLERLVTKTACYLSSGMLNLRQALTSCGTVTDG